MWCITPGRRILLIFVLAVPFALHAQPAAKMRQIGYLSWDRRDLMSENVAAFRQGLRELGWVEGENLAIEWRFAEGRPDLLSDLAAELVRLRLELIAGGEPEIRAARKLTSTIPLVMTVSAAPEQTGLVASLARPGGNVTGLSIMARDSASKRLELLKKTVPQASHIAVLWNAADQAKVLEYQDTQSAVEALGVILHSVEVRRPEDFDHAFATIAAMRPDALLVFAGYLTVAFRQEIADFALRHGLPTMSEIRTFADTGLLMTYGASLSALDRRAAYYVDRILKGAKPADLPVEQPRNLELVINLKTAKALGLTIPPAMLLQASALIR
jgi:putative ABC transport system substrate-binding protein